MLVDAYLSAREPERYEFVNSGISGNRIVDLYARIKCDVWQHQPDVLSILVGINDVYHDIWSNNGVDAKRFETVYRMLVKDTVERFPNIKMILMEPFLLPYTAITEEYEKNLPEVRLRGQIVKKIAEENGFAFLPLQQIFDDACKRAPADCWSPDGIHPFPSGHQLIADAWLKAFENLK